MNAFIPRRNRIFIPDRLHLHVEAATCLQFPAARRRYDLAKMRTGVALRVLRCAAAIELPHLPLEHTRRENKPEYSEGTVEAVSPRTFQSQGTRQRQRTPPIARFCRITVFPSSPVEARHLATGTREEV